MNTRGAAHWLLTYRIHCPLRRISEQAGHSPFRASLARNTLWDRVLHEVSWADTAALKGVIQSDPVASFMDGRLAGVVVDSGPTGDG